jgi:hypothetical protein
MKSIKAYFNTTTTIITLIIDADSANTYTKQYTSGAMILSYLKNASPASLPITVVAGDTLQITASTTGYVELY